MRLARRLKQKFYYALQVGNVPIYERDYDGNIVYVDIDGVKTPVPTGETEIGYSEPVEFHASIAMSGGEAEAQEYGLSISDYNATLICPKNAFPITEGTLIWHKSEIAYTDANNSVIDRTSADYECIKVSESVNLTKYILKAVVK
jgi:hypothetical protein